MYSSDGLPEQRSLHLLDDARLTPPLGIEVIPYLKTPAGKDDSHTKFVLYQGLSNAIPRTFFKGPPGCWIRVQLAFRPDKESLW